MGVADKEHYMNIGMKFYEWYRSGQLQFVYAGKGKKLSMEFSRISDLIDYVHNKKSSME